MFLFFALFFLPQVALAAELSDPKRPNEDAPFLLIADEVIYDQDLETVTATGKVEVSSDGRVLKADTVSYNQRDGVVTASGNVSVTESTGEVAFAEYLQLDDRLKTGFIESVSMLMTDDSKLAANGARRYEDERTEMSKAVFSPCKACAKHPDRPLLWQVKAVKVIHRRDTREIEYQDATLEVFGIPVFYLPFFRHPDPTVDRASGFLAPKFGNDSEIGFSVETPYFFNLAPDRDRLRKNLPAPLRPCGLLPRHRTDARQGAVRSRGRQDPRRPDRRLRRRRQAHRYFRRRRADGHDCT